MSVPLTYPLDPTARLDDRLAQRGHEDGGGLGVPAGTRAVSVFVWP